ncbi:hypothetical protein LG047_05195 [Methylocystis sp. WRRC1]|uniref:hypothetical protein n=1 Tax=Methylocystis sp. WRRC1 TaxID=1732014 RepID=UPI001D135AA5|nr:hypothetical protein [Methylocystis sp. WRRC1]MCC3244720.1 hypothetical protein [Methylocystis sp. WRRC1]
MSFPAATLANDADSLARSIRDHQPIKLDDFMPPHRIFDDEELDLLPGPTEPLAA